MLVARLKSSKHLWIGSLVDITHYLFIELRDLLYLNSDTYAFEA